MSQTSRATAGRIAACLPSKTRRASVKTSHNMTSGFGAYAPPKRRSMGLSLSFSPRNFTSMSRFRLRFSASRAASSEFDSRASQNAMNLNLWCKSEVMGSAVSLREDFDAERLRRLARQTTDAAQARRLLALASIYDGGSRSNAARLGSVTLQIVRDWVLRFNAHGRADQRQGSWAQITVGRYSAGGAPPLEFRSFNGSFPFKRRQAVW